MLNHLLSHEFRLLCGWIGTARATAEVLRGSFPDDLLPPDDESQVRGIEGRLVALLAELNRAADDYRAGNAPVDVGLANREYQRGVRELRECLDHLLRTADRVSGAVSDSVRRELLDVLAPLQKLQREPTRTLNELLERWSR